MVNMSSAGVLVFGFLNTIHILALQLIELGLWKGNDYKEGFSVVATTRLEMSLLSI